MVSARSLSKRSTTILIAAVLALGTGLLAFNYLSSVTKVARNVPMRSVVIALHDIPVRTVVTPALLSTIARPADSVEPGAVEDASSVAGQIALISIPSGGTISASNIGRLALGGLPVRIPRGQRAISIALDRVKGVADLIVAGDHVDVIAVMQSRGAAGGMLKAATILRNKVVLAMGSTLETPTAAGSPTPEIAVDTATLSVTPAEAKTLVLADINATLRLALRSNKDLNSTEADDPFVIPTADVPRPAVAAPAAAPPPVAKTAPANRQPPVRLGPALIDGDRLVNK